MNNQKLCGLTGGRAMPVTSISRSGAFVRARQVRR